MLYDVGDGTEPCGTLAYIALGADSSPTTETTELLVLVI
jgi:hypothetical protein